MKNCLSNRKSQFQQYGYSKLPGLDVYFCNYCPHKSRTSYFVLENFVNLFYFPTRFFKFNNNK